MTTTMTTRQRTSPTSTTLALLAGSLLVAACATGPGAPGLPERAPGPHPPAPDLPPVPAVDGPLLLDVVYPADSAYVGTRGRTFLFGSAGTGRARVWVDDEEVEVAPNGAFLAFVPVPDDGVYHLRATRGGETARLDRPVRLPPPPPTAAEDPQILPGSAAPSGAWAARPGERIPVSFRGTAGGEAWLAFGDGATVPLVERDPVDGGATDFEVAPGADDADRPDRVVSTYSGFFTARRVLSTAPTTAWPVLTGEPRPSRVRERAGATLVLAVGGDTVARALPVNLVLVDPDRPRTGVGFDPDPPERNGDRHIIARPGPGSGPYHYVWRNGVELELTGERNGAFRVRLTDALDAWTPAAGIRLRPVGAPPPESRVSVVRLDPQPGWIDVHVGLDRRLPYLVTEHERSISLRVFGATSRASFLQHGRVDPYIARAEWSQPADRIFALDIHLTAPPWGYETLWNGEDLVLRLNRSPAIDADAPLRGLRIGVDPGHGGAHAGAVGPTGLREADANLRIARALRDRLERQGAEVVMTRTGDETVQLVERTDLARERDVDVLVSVHNNAFPDGVDPWANNGTSVYYNHASSAGLAWSVHRALLLELGLRDIGVGRADLHLPRFTWAPSILTETAFMMVPVQEAFLRSDEGARRIADAHVDGLRRWLARVGSP